MCEMTDSVLLELQKDISEIKAALLGNEYNPAGGVLTRLALSEKNHEMMEIELNDLRNKFNKIVAYAVGAGTAAGTLISVVIPWLKSM